MAEFKMMTRPKKPESWGSITRTFWAGISIPELLKQLELFIKDYPHLQLHDITIDFSYESYEDNPYGMHLEAAGKSPSQYEKEMEQYKKELKAWKQWRLDHKDDIEAWKEAEKKRKATAKLERRHQRMLKEAAKIQAEFDKLKKVK